MALESFEDRILSDLLPAFCNDPGRQYDTLGFKSNIHKVHELDAANFLRALDTGLVKLVGNLYRAPRSGAGEQLFWEYSKKSNPMPFSVWIEPIITIASLARLHHEYGWPKDWLGTQSERDWAFDLMSYIDPEFSNGYIAAEVKKTVLETNSVVRKMREFGASPQRTVVEKKDKNAWNKVKALRSRRAPIFWAVGPGGYGAVFKMSYPDDQLVVFEEATSAELICPCPRA